MQSDRFMELLDDMRDMHIRKAEDYGNDEDPLINIKASANWGVQPWIGALMRMDDKVQRLRRFAAKGKLANESAKDSMIDIACYALISYILYEQEDIS